MVSRQDDYVTRREFMEWQLQTERHFMSTQADVDALTQAINQVASDLATEQSDLSAATSSLQTEINNLAAANPSLDISALQTAVAPLDATVETLDAATKALGALVPTPPTP